MDTAAHTGYVEPLHLGNGRLAEVAAMEHENSIVVGVRAWSGSESAERTREWGASIGALWVECDGVRWPGDLISVRLSDIEGQSFQFATIDVIVGKFETVPGAETACARCGLVSELRGETQCEPCRRVRALLASA